MTALVASPADWEPFGPVPPVGLTQVSSLPALSTWRPKSLLDANMQAKQQLVARAVPVCPSFDLLLPCTLRRWKRAFPPE